MPTRKCFDEDLLYKPNKKCNFVGAKKTKRKWKRKI